MGTVDTPFLGGEICSYRVHLKRSSDAKFTLQVA